MLGSKRKVAKSGLKKEIVTTSLSDASEASEFTPLVDLGIGKLGLVKMNDAGVQKWALQYDHESEADYTLIAESSSRAAMAIDDGSTSNRFSLMTMVDKNSSQQVTDTMKKSQHHNVAVLDLYLHNQTDPSEVHIYKVYVANQDKGSTDDMIVTVVSV